MVSDYETVISDLQSEISEEVFRNEQMDIDKRDTAASLVKNMLQNMQLDPSEKTFFSFIESS